VIDFSKELTDAIVNAYGEEPLRKIADIICYESGDLLRDTIRLEDYPDDVSQRIYMKQSFVSVGDILAMSQLFCNKAGFKLSDVYEQGCERAIERCKEKMKGMTGF